MWRKKERCNDSNLKAGAPMGMWVRGMGEIYVQSSEMDFYLKKTTCKTFALARPVGVREKSKLTSNRPKRSSSGRKCPSKFSCFSFSEPRTEIFLQKVSKVFK